MTITRATIAKSARLWSPTGHSGVLNKEVVAEVVSEKYGIFKVLIHGRMFSVDYKFVTLID
jgi:hypothetical protein